MHTSKNIKLNLLQNDIFVTSATHAIIFLWLICNTYYNIFVTDLLHMLWYIWDWFVMCAMISTTLFVMLVTSYPGLWAPATPGVGEDGGRSWEPGPEGVPTDADVDPRESDHGGATEVPPMSHRCTPVGRLLPDPLTPK